MKTDGDAIVNLLLNHASPWLDVNSYLPYEGKVVIRNKTANRLAVRIPLWAPKDKVEATIDGEPAETRWIERLLIFDTIRPEDEITIEFPVVETTETYTLKWKESDFWYESTNPGWNWRPDEEPARLTMTFKGNTMVDISPRSRSRGYPLYQRDHLRDGEWEKARASDLAFHETVIAATHNELLKSICAGIHEIIFDWMKLIANRSESGHLAHRPIQEAIQEADEKRARLMRAVSPLAPLPGCQAPSG